MKEKVKNKFILVILLNIFIPGLLQCQTMNIFTKTGVVSYKLSDIDSMNFTAGTASSVPVITTTAISGITKVGAVSGGTVKSDGGGTIIARGVCWSTSATPTINDNKSSDSIGTGSFTSRITKLLANTTYNVRAYATNDAGTGYGNVLSFKTLGSEGTVADIDGNVYSYVKIGTQTWMTENLKTTKYRNGSALPNVTGDGIWNSLTTGAYCNYDNNTTNSVEYGLLYNWYAVNDGRGLAPQGWHVAADSDWTTLINYLGGENVAGGKLKEAGFTHWLTPNTGATDENGFTLFPGGSRNQNGVYSNLGMYGDYWCNTEVSPYYAYYRHFYYNYGGVSKTYCNKKYGLSVRCVKD